MPDERPWVTDTVIFSHLARAGHLEILERLAPGGLLLVPSPVDAEIQNAREDHQGVPFPSGLSWVELAVLTPEESDTFWAIKGLLGGGQTRNVGESAAIAVAKHRDGVALLDDKAARRRADQHGVDFRMTPWVVAAAFLRLGYGRSRTVDVVDALLRTGMRLPIKSGEELFAHAYEHGWVPDQDEFPGVWVLPS